VKLHKIWIVRDRTPLVESIEELIFATVLRGSDDDAVNLCHLVLGCAPGTWDAEHLVVRHARRRTGRSPAAVGGVRVVTNDYKVAKVNRQRPVFL
jgi:hypothetical protein